MEKGVVEAEKTNLWDGMRRWVRLRNQRIESEVPPVAQLMAMARVESATFGRVDQCIEKW